jgi:hypothetical protein
MGLASLDFLSLFTDATPDCGILKNGNLLLKSCKDKGDYRVTLSVYYYCNLNLSFNDRCFIKEYGLYMLN